MSALEQAKAHLRKAEEFLAAAEMSADRGLFNAATSDAVVSGINAKDAICLKLTGRTGKADDHSMAVTELSGASQVGKSLAPTLQRLLRLKSRSQYQSVSVAQSDGRSAIGWAQKMYESAQSIVQN